MKPRSPDQDNKDTITIDAIVDIACQMILGAPPTSPDSPLEERMRRTVVR